MFTVIGAGLGTIIVAAFSKLDIDFFSNWNPRIVSAIKVLIIFIFAIIFFICSPRALNYIEDLLKRWEEELKDKAASEIVVGSVGLIVGLVIAFLISQPLFQIPIPYLGAALSVVLYGMLGYLGIKISVKNAEDILSKFKDIQIGKKEKTYKEKSEKIEKSIKKDKRIIASIKEKDGIPKILDTSVIIDGRIREITRSGFLEGPLIVPVFVLEELQHIADSEDALKRNRGRRGLDIINAIQEDKNIEVIIYNGMYEDVPEVDSKLLHLTKDLDGRIVTNDYNLNKVAVVQGLVVLNINELANSVKPVYLPGEEMQILIVKQGKEAGQGLGYLDDGTMIVVESGKNYIGQTINVVVTSVLQTSAGKMIFARPDGKNHVKLD